MEFADDVHHNKLHEDEVVLILRVLYGVVLVPVSALRLPDAVHELGLSAAAQENSKIHYFQFFEAEPDFLEL